RPPRGELPGVPFRRHGGAGPGAARLEDPPVVQPLGQQHRRYLVCGIGHHLGLDVHDCSQAQWEDYMGADLEAGMVMTVEPGLYFHENDLTVPPELRGIGVRLEDDLLLTASGAEVLSEALPIDATGIENWTRSHASSA